MSVNLQKGQKVNLRKSESERLSRVMVGLGWDEIEQPRKKGLFGLFSSQPQTMDCDASAILCKNGKLQSNEDVVFYNRLRHPSGAVVHQGDNLTGEGEGDDEQIFVDLDEVPSEYDRIVFVVTIYQAKEKNQHFGMVANAFIRICDAKNGNEFCKFDLSENYSGKTAMIAGEMVKENGEWKFNAIGQGTNDNGIVDMAARFR